MSDLENAPEFLINRHFAAPPEAVFDAWADPQKMAAWSGPKGAKVTIIQGEMSPGKATITRSDSETLPLMHTLSLWREITPHSRIAWEQSFCDAEGNKTAPPFFDDWPLTLLTTVDFERDGEGTLVRLSWKPIESTPEGLAMFEKQMTSMKGGWGGSFEKLDEFLAESA